MEESYNRIQTLLQKLIAYSLPQGTGKDVIQKYLQYFMRILTSRMKTSYIQDENSLKNLICKRLINQNESNSQNQVKVSQSVMQLQEMFQRLNKCKVLKNQWGILYVLNNVADLTEYQLNDSIGNTITIFQTREIEKITEEVSKSIQVQDQTKMEIETTVNVSLSSNQPQIILKTEKDSKNMKMLNKVMNKGNDQVNLNESDLLRDILFVFQGIEGHYIKYVKGTNSYAVQSTLPVSGPVRKMINSLCEIGWLFSKVTNFIQQNGNGLIHQSLCTGIKEELTEYYQLLSILENTREKEEQKLCGLAEQYTPRNLNLRKLYLWMNEPLERLQWLSIISDSCSGLKGCCILSCLSVYSMQGSPLIKSLIQRIMKSILRPFLNFIEKWIYFGELNDNQGEFFVSMNPQVIDNQMWNDRYRLNIQMIPTFLSQQIAEVILLIGKSVNFLRKCCQVNDWVLKLEFIDAQSILDTQLAEHSGLNKFREWIQAAGRMTNQKLLEIFNEKYNFNGHCISLKKYLLLGQGDFVNSLMNLLYNELQKPAITLFRHNLLSVLETAIRSSNTQYHNHIYLSRLDIKLMEASAGDNGWDIFCLDYKVDSPISTVFTPNIMKQYLKIFNFLWKIKRIEYELHQIWRTQIKSLNNIKSKMHKYYLIKHEMIHFIQNLLSYIMVEVIEGSWTKFQENLKQVQNLNQLIAIHQQFIEYISENILLTPKYEVLYKQLHKIFNTILQFKTLQDILMNKALEDYYETHYNYSETFTSLDNISNSFSVLFYEFTNTINDVFPEKLRFLCFKLDFNEYYKYNQSNKIDNYQYSNVKIQPYQYMYQASKEQISQNINSSQNHINTKSLKYKNNSKPIFISNTLKGTSSRNIQENENSNNDKIIDENDYQDNLEQSYNEEDYNSEENKYNSDDN